MTKNRFRYSMRVWDDSGFCGCVLAKKGQDTGLPLLLFLDTTIDFC